MTINELRTKRATLWNTMEGFLDTHRTDKDAYTHGLFRPASGKQNEYLSV